MVTVYGLAAADRASDAPTVESIVRERKIEHAVLVDPTQGYLRALEPGPLKYPAAYLVARGGTVAWESTTDRLDFGARCEEAIERALASPAPQADGGKSPAGTTPAGPR